MISISQWGQFDPADKALVGFPPIQMMAEFYRLKREIDRLSKPMGQMIVSGTYLKLIA